MSTEQSLKGSSGSKFSGAYFGGMILLYLGERLQWETPSVRIVLALLAIAAIGFAVTGRIFRRNALSSSARTVEGWILCCYLVGIASLVVYLGQADFMMDKLRPLFSEAKSATRYEVILAAIWPAIWLCSVLPLIFLEIVYAPMDLTRTVEINSLQRTLRASLTFAMTLGTLVALNYIVSEFNKKVDLSYFKTSSASESSRNMVRNLTEPVTVFLFFPGGGNEVFDEVYSYFEGLKQESKFLTVEVKDQALEPKLAEENSVTKNGTVAFVRGTNRHQISIGTKIDLKSVRDKLKKLDQDFQQAFYKVAGDSRIVYFTTGHGELEHVLRDGAPGASVRELRKVLQELNYQVKNLPLITGLGAEIPDDATILVIASPRQKFMPAEVKAIKSYLRRGGKALVMLDPESGEDMADVLGTFGVKFTPQLLANDRAFVRMTYTPADHGILFANRYTVHPVVNTLDRLSNQVGLIFPGAGYLDEIPPTEGDKVKVQFLVHSFPHVWNDLNGNFQHDEPNEKRKLYELVAAVTHQVDPALIKQREAKKTEAEKAEAKKDNNKPMTKVEAEKEEKKKEAQNKAKASDNEMRMLVLSDTDGISDKVYQVELKRYMGTHLFVLDAIRWLGGEEEFVGEATTEDDEPIVHTRKEDQLWFYLTIFGMPALVLTSGLYYTRRRRSR